MTTFRHVGLAVVAFSLSALSLPVSAQPQPLIPRKVLFGYPEHTAPQLSPDGTQIGYLHSVDGKAEVWVRTAGRSDDHPITSPNADEKGSVTQFFWHGDGKQVFFQRDPLGNRIAPLFLLNIATGQTRNITPWERTSVFFTAYNPKVDPNSLLITSNKEGGRHYDVYRMDTLTGKATLDTKAPDNWGWMSWAVGADLVVHGVSVDLPDGSHILRARTSADSEWRDLLHSGTAEDAGILTWEDNYRSAIVMTNVGSDTTHLEKIDVDTGQRSVILRAPKGVELGGIWINPDTAKIDLLQYQGDIRKMVALDPALKADLAVLAKVHNGVIDGIDRTAGSSRWMVTYRTSSATWWYFYDRATRRATPIYADVPALENYKLAAKQPIRFKARDGLLLHGYITLPATHKQHQRLPMVVLVHGGPQRRDEWGYDPWVMWLADRGYAVLQVNFRGSDGFGKKFIAAGLHQWAGAMQDDLLDGKSWAIDHGYADPSHICIMGGSYGGYATLAALTFHPSEFACGVALAAPSDLELEFKSDPHDNDFIRMIGTNVPEMVAASPDRFADRVRVPLLLGQGGSDWNVRPEQGQAMVDAMRKSNKPITYYFFPEERHGFGTEEDSFAFNAAIEQFLAPILGGRFEPPTPDELKILQAAKR